MRNNDEDTELIQDLLNGDCDELNRKVGLFLDQCPSFLHSVGRSRFFPAFFFGMFATAFDSGIIDFEPDIANGERIYFRFDNYDNGKGNLKIAVLTNDVDEDGIRIVRCYTVADNENSPGSRFSEEERLWIEENQLQHLQEDLTWEEYKIFQRGEECVFFPQGRDFNGNHASPINNFREVAPIMQQGNLLDRVNGLANNNSLEVDSKVPEKDKVRELAQFWKMLFTNISYFKASDSEDVIEEIEKYFEFYGDIEKIAQEVNKIVEEKGISKAGPQMDVLRWKLKEAIEKAEDEKDSVSSSAVYDAQFDLISQQRKVVNQLTAIQLEITQEHLLSATRSLEKSEELREDYRRQFDTVLEKNQKMEQRLDRLAQQMERMMQNQAPSSSLNEVDPISRSSSIGSDIEFVGRK